MKEYFEVCTSILDNPKFGLLSDRLYRRYFELVLIASRNKDNGRLPEETSDIAWLLRISEEELLKDLSELMNIGLVVIVDDLITISNDSIRLR
jgi:hypothetical protein